MDHAELSKPIASAGVGSGRPRSLCWAASLELLSDRWGRSNPFAGLGALAISLGLLGSYIRLRWRSGALRRRGVAAVGRVLKVDREWGEGGRGWVSEIEFIDALGDERRFDARGRFEREVGVSYDPRRPTRARVTTRSPFPAPPSWQLLLIYSGLSVMVFAWLALFAAGMLLITEQWELSSEVLHGG